MGLDFMALFDLSGRSKTGLKWPFIFHEWQFFISHETRRIHAPSTDKRKSKWARSSLSKILNVSSSESLFATGRQELINFVKQQEEAQLLSCCSKSKFNVASSSEAVVLKDEIDSYFFFPLKMEENRPLPSGSSKNSRNLPENLKVSFEEHPFWEILSN